MIREIVKIDEDKCNGCGDCVPGCAEGAIQIINGKAKLVADNLCDGLGACLGHCPMDAITIEKRQADEFDEAAVEEHLEKSVAPSAHGHGHSHGHGGCPSAQVRSFAAPAGHGGGCPSAQERSFAAEKTAEDEVGVRPSQLRQWPVQMHLVPPTAPFLKDADLLLAADCVPFAYADFHKDFLKDKALLIGCPKLDDGQAYLQKLTTMLQQNNIRSLTVLHMEVPCCSGLIAIARQALAASGKEIPLETIRIGIQGERK
ncbi:ATP-binding protein [Trichloromonas acetexigens]|uniref:4Fe-4S ferredoxin n=1 Tax=Trichloromonas acetexigens TaxID=38815 RepID=A0A550JHN1_9BACT|nr:4Fe-4S dicluster domain-containing protein [Desulfuromonas acetexigens]TRO82693.1 4Fe-4S ferredoxin [Desulfuromonas acetexigens]